METQLCFHATLGSNRMVVVEVYVMASQVINVEAERQFFNAFLSSMPPARNAADAVRASEAIALYMHARYPHSAVSADVKLAWGEGARCRITAEEEV